VCVCVCVVCVCVCVRVIVCVCARRAHGVCMYAWGGVCMEQTQAYLQKIKKEIQEHCSTRIQKPAALVAILKKRALKAHPSGRTLVRIDSSFLHGSHVPKADLQVPASIAEDGAGEGEGDAVPITSSSSGAADSAAGAASAASLASESPRERAGSSMDGEQPSATKPTAPTPAEGQPQPRRVSQMSRSDSPEPVVPTPLPPTSGAGDKPPVARGGRKYVPALEASVRQGLKEEEEGFAAGVEGDPWRSVVAVAFLKRASWRPPPLHFDTVRAFAAIDGCPCWLVSRSPFLPWRHSILFCVVVLLWWICVVWHTDEANIAGS